MLALWIEACLRAHTIICDLSYGERGIFPFEDLRDALARVKHGELEQSNAVIQVAE